MQFVRSESKERPQEVSKISGGRYLIRENITEETRTGIDGQQITVFVCDEAVATEVEYALYMAESKRESAIVDEYTLTLINEGVL